MNMEISMEWIKNNEKKMFGDTNIFAEIWNKP